MEIGPAGLFNDFLKRFGTTSPQVAIVSSTIIVAFGLKDRIDVGIWTVVWLLTFVFSYLVSDLLPRTTAKALLFCLVFFACAGAAAWAAANYAPAQIGLLSSKPVLSGLAAYLLAQPTAVLLFAYQHLSRSLGRPLPASLVELAEREIWGASFYREDMKYDVEFLASAGGRVEVTTKLSYKVANRSFERLSYPITLKHDPANGRVVSFRIDHAPQPTADPDTQTQSGLRYNLPLAPGQTAFVEAELVESLSVPGWEMFGTYYPTTHFALILRNRSHPTLRLDVEQFTPASPVFSGSEEERVYALPLGLLPNQGFRVHWSA